MPEIKFDIKYNKDLSKIVSIFKNKGHQIADQNFVQNNLQLNNVKMILGQDNCHILPERDVIVGNESIYSTTPLGIMIKGKISNYKNDLKHLKPNLKKLVNSENANNCSKKVTRNMQLEEKPIIKNSKRENQKKTTKNNLIRNNSSKNYKKSK